MSNSALPSSTLRPKVLGLGSASVDYLASVTSYPEKDSKIRTTSLNIMGGGNCANTLTAIQRLNCGIDTSIITKMGIDANGQFILNDLQSEKIDTTHVINKPDIATGFVYVIVDPSTQTRTCIATPVEEEITPSEISSLINDKHVLNPPQGSDDVTVDSNSSNDRNTSKNSSSNNNDSFSNIALLHLDSRHTQAAFILAQQAHQQCPNVLISIDAEKDRPPYFENLLPLCHILFTNQTFTSNYITSQTHKGSLDEVNYKLQYKLVCISSDNDLQGNDEGESCSNNNGNKVRRTSKMSFSSSSSSSSPVDNYYSALDSITSKWYTHEFIQNYNNDKNKDKATTTTLNENEEVDEECLDLLTRLISMRQFFHLTQSSSSTVSAATSSSSVHSNDSSCMNNIQMIVSTMGAQGSVLLKKKNAFDGNPFKRSNTDDDEKKAVQPAAVDDDAAVESEELVLEESLLCRKAPLQVQNYIFFIKGLCGDFKFVQGYDVIRCSAWPLKQQGLNSRTHNVNCSSTNNNGNSNDNDNHSVETSTIKTDNKDDADRAYIVDTTGAGDAYIGGFLTAFLLHWSYASCMRLGTSVAAEKLQCTGSRPGLPSSQELVRKLLKLKDQH